MTQKRHYPHPAAALIGVVLLVLFGMGIHRAGWSQGYMLSQWAQQAPEGAPVPPGMMPGYGPMAHGMRPAGFLHVVLLVIGLIVVSRIVHAWMWRQHAGKGDQPPAWVRHWHRYHPHPPFAWCGGEPEAGDASESGAEDAPEA